MIELVSTPPAFEPLENTSPSTSPWSRTERVAFRLVVAYFALFWLGGAIELLAGSHSQGAARRDALVRWIGRALLGMRGEIPIAGREWAAAQFVLALLLALSATVIWSALARRTEYERFAGWCRIALRYYLGVIMLVYGGAKVIPSQFPPIAVEQISEPLGNLSPQALLWAYMGYSRIYTIFTGVGEALGALLLFFRRTTTLGAAILVAVLSNVVLINFAYDVPVKQLSTNLLIGAIALTIVDVRRLISVFVLNRPTPAAKLDFPLSAVVSRLRRVLKPAIIVLATCLPLVFSSFVHRRAEARSPLYGVYDVREFTRVGQSGERTSADVTRWERVVFGRPFTASIHFGNDSAATLFATIDTVNHRLSFRSSAASPDISVLSYLERGDTLTMRGTVAGDSVAITLHRVNAEERYRLLR